jgi:hypothetical protein
MEESMNVAVLKRKNPGIFAKGLKTTMEIQVSLAHMLCPYEL